MPSNIDAMKQFSDIARTVNGLITIEKALRVLGMDKAADEILFTREHVDYLADEGRQMISDGIDEAYNETMKNTGDLLSTLVDLSLKGDKDGDSKETI